MLKKIMVLGTSSGAGKSTVAAGLIRAFRNRGLKPCPFKSQNMSLNSYVDINGGEMGRAQVLQAQCADILPMAWMNPVLLKPIGDRKSQVIYMGKPVASMSAMEYEGYKTSLKEDIIEGFNRNTAPYDIAVIEGAGSPAEINLKTRDIVNMGFAKMADAPCILVGDIDKGGVFAAIYGTLMLLDEDERKFIKGFVINKFRGDIRILTPGIEMMEEKLGIPCLGVIPYERFNLEEEDGAVELNVRADSDIDICALRLGRLSNFTDLTAFASESDVSVRYASGPEEIGDPDILVIPGTRNTIDDLKRIKENGIFDKVRELKEKGTRIIGICGGYQMLLDEVRDPLHIEGDIVLEKGFGFLKGSTQMAKIKTTELAEGTAIYKGKELSVYGYEIHAGVTEHSGSSFIEKKDGTYDGALSEDGRVIGTYFHGIFDGKELRQEVLNEIRREKGLEEKVSSDISEMRIREMDRLGRLMEDSLDIGRILKIAGGGV